MLLVFPVSVLEFQGFFFRDRKSEVLHRMCHTINAGAVHRHGARHYLIKNFIAVHARSRIQCIHIYIIFILPQFFKCPFKRLNHIVQGFIHVKYYVHFLLCFPSIVIVSLFYIAPLFYVAQLVHSVFPVKLIFQKKTPTGKDFPRESLYILYWETERKYSFRPVHI